MLGNTVKKYKKYTLKTIKHYLKISIFIQKHFIRILDHIPNFIRLQLLIILIIIKVIIYHQMIMHMLKVL